MTQCRCVSEIKYPEFSQSLYGRIMRCRIPFEGMVELTYRCNLKCAHCYCNEAADNRQACSKELSTADVYKMLDDIAERGCLWLIFSGGEPLLREDFRDIYLYAKSKGFLILLFTNATLITTEMAEFLKERPPFRVEVTVYGATKDVYEKMTGVTGSFERCMAGINNLHKACIDLRLKTMVTTLNRHELNGMKTLAGSLGVEFRFDAMIQSRIDGSKGPLKYRISAEDVARLDVADDDRREAWRRYLEDSGAAEVPDTLFCCGGGQTSFVIDPYGFVGICDMCRQYSYDIKKSSFVSIWDERFPELLKIRYKQDLKCKSCDSVLYCNYCAGWAMAETGDPESIVEYICEAARMRKEIFEGKR